MCNEIKGNEMTLEELNKQVEIYEAKYDELFDKVNGVRSEIELYEEDDTSYEEAELEGLLNDVNVVNIHLEKLHTLIIEK